MNADLVERLEAANDALIGAAEHHDAIRVAASALRALRDAPVIKLDQNEADYWGLGRKWQTVRLVVVGEDGK